MKKKKSSTSTSTSTKVKYSREQLLEKQLSRYKKKCEILEHELELHTRKLYKSKEFLSEVLNNLQSYILVTDNKGSIKQANKTFLESLNLENNTLKQRKVSDFLNFQESGLDIELLKELLPSSNSALYSHFQHQNLKKRIPVSLSCSKMQDPNSSEEFFVLNFVSLEHKEKLLSEIQKRIESEASSQAKDKFFAMLTHEMRTPLNTVLGMIDLAEKEKNIKTRTQYLSSAQNSGKMLLCLIDDILDLSKLSYKSITFRKEEFSVLSLLKKSFYSFKKDALDKKLKIALRVNEETLKRPVLGDPKRFQQICMNLISNAIKYTNKGSIRVSLKKLPDEKSSTCNLELKIQDTGAGISKKNQQKIFQPFTQFNLNPHEGIKGIGLGLSICKILIEKMNGSITCKSKVNCGSIFTVKISLPYSNTVHIPEKLTNKTNASKTPKDLKILVAEDNLMNQKLIAIYLNKLEIPYKIVNNGAEAFQEVKSNSYNLIFMDCRMPILNGLESTQKIRKLKKSKDKPWIIAVTANSNEEDRKECLKAGMNDFLSKPLLLETLQKKIEEFLSKHTKKEKLAS